MLSLTVAATTKLTALLAFGGPGRFLDGFVDDSVAAQIRIDVTWMGTVIGAARVS